MDLELREALALAEDRDVALAHLLPGSEDHDYFRCLRAQHAGALDDADAIIHAWPERHGQTERYRRLQLRQLLLRVTGDTPALAADNVRDWFGVSHWHEAEVESIDPTRPTRIAEGAFDGARLLQQAMEHDSHLSQVTDEGLYELLERPLDPPRRRVLLGRIGHTPQPALVEQIALDLEAKQSGGFGSLAIHDQLTHEQLLALATHHPELTGHLGWVSAVIKRMIPLRANVDLELDREARHAYLLALWTFVADLPPAINSLKAHILWHLLDAGRQLATPPDPQLFATYLQLPRAADYLARDWIDRVRRDDVAQLGHDFRSVTGLPPAGDDEQLVRELLAAQLDAAESFARWLDRSWLDTEIATARLLFGRGDTDRATLALGPARAAALRERIELSWCLHNPTRFGIDEPVVLEADVKHVPELVVKVFRIDPLAYFQNQKRAVGPDLDLDGLAASHEIVLELREPAVRRVRRRIELPMCARAGTYVIDLIGNGMSSRAVIQKGRLRQMMRIGGAGHHVTIVDEAGRPRPDARAWIGDREYLPDATGTFIVPFSTAPGRTPALLFCGDLATVQDITLYREGYQLTTHVMLDRESLTAGRTATAIVRASLTNNGAPVSLSVLQRTSWDVTLTDAHGVATTKSSPLVLDDDDAAVLEWPMGEDTAQVSIAIRGTVTIRSEQRDQELLDLRSFEVGAIHRTTSIEALFLARTEGGFVISALGKSGEPRAHRPVTVGLVHRWSRIQVNLELATDAHGRIELGHLPGISRISATLGTVTPTWWIEDHLGSFGIQSRAGKDVVIPLSPSRTAAEVIRRMSLVETNGVPVHHPQVTLVALEDSVTIRGLRAGEYQLRAPGIGQVSIVVLDVRAEIRSIAFTPGEVGELSRSAPAIAEITTRDDLRIRLVTPGERTRVHVIATTFAPSLLELPWIGPRGVGRRSDRARGATYVSGRELGDEYRYILDRRSAKRYPGLLLERPSLLLNPWSRRTTTTDVATARAGGVFASAAQMSAGHVGSAPEAKATAPANTEAFASYDFLGAPPAVLANLCPDADGVVTVPRTALGSAASVIIIVDDPAGTMVRYIALPETTLEPRDLRLRLALDPARHATQRKAIQPLRAGEHLVIEDLATAKVHLVDSVERAHAYLLALREDATLRELSFITRWHQLPDHERRERYSKYACHELHLFLYFKDRVFFDAVVAPYLAHKRTKTFVDHWLLGANLSTYLEPRQLMRLNAVERALLARRMQAGDAIGRILGDEVAVLPPDPNLDTRLIDGLLGASTLDGDEGIAAAHADAFEMAEESYPSPMASMAGPDGGGFGSARPAAPPPAAPRRPAAKTMQREQAKKKSDSRGRAADDDFADHDGEAEAPTPMYRTVDKTQEWAETNWWQRTPAQSTASMIQPNRLWRDLAEHRDGPFLSPGLGLATGSFAEAMCALAVTDLAFVAPSHTITPEGPRLTIAAAGNALAGSSQLVDGELITGGAPLVVGMSFVRSDDRHDWVNGEQVDKYVDGPFATGVVYTCLVVLANPTSSRQRIAALVQVPRGSIPVAGARATQTIDVVLEPYGTHGHEYSFYFPAPGTWSQFPVHVSRAGTIVAAAPGGTLEVVSGGATADPRSWPYISQRAPLVELTTYLATANLKAIDLSRMAWRLRDRTAYHQIISVLEQRRAFDATAWGYSLQHGDAPRIRVFLRSLDAQLLAAGPVLDMLGLDAEDLDAYEHLEHAPLINARAHRLGPKLRILNDGLAAQYTRFLELVSHRASPTAEDLLAATAYLLAQDRLEAALAMFARVDPSKLADRMQHDYLAAFTACIAGDLGRARHLATPWRELPVDRWRHRFAALLAMLDELDGIAPAAVIDPRSRDQQHAELASRQPTFDLALGREGIVIRSSHVAALELRFFEMDIELLFSRQPFVQSDVSRFSFIEPGHREHLEQLAPEQRVPWPAALRGKNVVVEAVGAGQRKAKVHYANDLSTTVSNQVGQIRVSRASDHASLPATYVKVYARKQGGQVTFYKDGYTDLRGWFEYATLSTTDLDHVERFAILVCSDQAGAAILEASPPTR